MNEQDYDHDDEGQEPDCCTNAIGSSLHRHTAVCFGEDGL